MTRFGPSLPGVADVGYDLLSLQLHEESRTFTCHTFLTGLARPTDVKVAGSGRVYLLEYDQTRTGYLSGSGEGRLLEITYAPRPAPATQLAASQHLRVAGNGGFQTLYYRYSNGQTWVSPWQPAPGTVSYPPVGSEFIGLYHYDYTAGRFSRGLYQMKEQLQP